MAPSEGTALVACANVFHAARRGVTKYSPHLSRLRGLRLIDGDSFDWYLEGLANKEFTPSPCKRGKGRGRPKKQRIPDEMRA